MRFRSRQATNLERAAPARGRAAPRRSGSAERDTLHAGELALHLASLRHCIIHWRDVHYGRREKSVQRRGSSTIANIGFGVRDGSCCFGPPPETSPAEKYSIFSAVFRPKNTTYSTAIWPLTTAWQLANDGWLMAIDG